MNCSRGMNYSRGMTNKTKTSDKKYCGVCHKAGKPASEYESHYTKSVPGPTGIVTCPMILASVCNRCGKSGHFSDHCSLKKPLPPKNNRLATRAADPAPVAPSPVRRYANAYAALAADADGEEVMPVVKQPKITVEKEIASLAPNGISFAAMLLKPAPAPVVETGFKISPKLQTLLASEEKSEKVLLAEKIISERCNKRRSWVDLTDDEDEDECEDNTAW